MSKSAFKIISNDTHIAYEFYMNSVGFRDRKSSVDFCVGKNCGWGLLSSIWKNVDDRIYRLTVRVRLFFPGHSEYLTWKILENLLKLLIFQVLKSKILVFWKRDVSIQNDKVTENILRCSPNILRRLKIKLWNQLTKNLIPYLLFFDWLVPYAWFWEFRTLPGC